MSDQFHWDLDLAIKDGQLENFKALAEEMAAATEANEPGTVNYQWYISDDNKTGHIFERFTDSAAAMAHLGAFGQNFAERFMATLDLVRFEVYGNPSDEVKDAIAGMGAVTMKPLTGYAR